MKEMTGTERVARSRQREKQIAAAIRKLKNIWHRPDEKPRRAQEIIVLYKGGGAAVFPAAIGDRERWKKWAYYADFMNLEAKLYAICPEDAKAYLYTDALIKS